MMQSLPRCGYATLTYSRFSPRVHLSRLACSTFVTSIPQLKSSVLFEDIEKEPDSGNTEDAAQNRGEAKQNGIGRISKPIGRSANFRLVRHVKISGQTSSVMRELMRGMPHPVVVVTASSWTAESQQITHQAMTISSFNTVTLDPEPIISFNIRTPSRTLDTILAQKGHFRIHILSNSREGSFIADAFTLGNAEEGFRTIQASGVNVRFSTGDNPSAPTIACNAVKAILHCVLLPSKMITIQDHIVALAQVTQVDYKSRSKMALMYVDRAYRKVGRPIMDHKGQGDQGFPLVLKPQDEQLRKEIAENSTPIEKASDSSESTCSISDPTKWQNDADEDAQTEIHVLTVAGEANTGSSQQAEAAKDNVSASFHTRKFNSNSHTSQRGNGARGRGRIN